MTTVSLPRILIAGTHSGSGKTTVTLAILSAFARRGLKVQAFKAGPDFIDPSHHTALTGRPSRNLDTWMLPQDAVLEILADGAIGADVGVIEGVMGLYDGFAGNQDVGSTAHLAKMLQTPVVLVVDARGMARSAAAMVKGFTEFDPALNFAGVIFNNVGSARHYDFLKIAVEHSLKIPLLGYLPKDKKIMMPERHLGLIPSQELQAGDSMADNLATLAESSINLDRILEQARQAPMLEAAQKIFRAQPIKQGQKKYRIAIAWDKAFHFYYPENLRLLTLAGAELVYFSPMADKQLPPDIDMIYIGGGFPEVFAQSLSENNTLRTEIRDFILARKKPVYAECGGLMYLCEGIRDAAGKTFPMAGVIPADAVMAGKLSALGYIQAEVVEDNVLSHKGQTLRGHEFHWSYLEGKEGFDKLLYAYTIRDRSGQRDKRDGIMIENMLASYAHLHFANAPELAKRIMEGL